ncbi:hypothetical protein FR192_21820 [Salmonella enterica subsp. enterica]|nr:hypothetical protein [Salmonella enterica subsp. enterica]
MGSCAAPSAKGDDKFITTDYLQQCLRYRHQDMPRQRHGRRHSIVSYDTGVKPPKPGVSRY